MRRTTYVLPALLVALLAVGCGADEPSAAPGPSASATSIDEVETFDDLSRDHVEGDVDYPQSPPVGGDHDPRWLTCTGTVYDEPVRDENAVHAMEHGAVWVAYEPSLPADEVAALAGLVEERDYSFLSPYPGLDAPVVLTAWGLQLAVDTPTDTRVEQFLTAYANGPQTPEPGATCEGGVEMDEHDDTEG